ncbi:MAG TPA: hypothetical protein DCZ92_01640 [Elusimicrobia bacterium]|nr:MAG: hypothetical protein A2016_12275 [Elusimicrobia bacterium GWF2_62_30]HBA59529.1 hypothetical protein [Elusimicrobiota bacterium]
MEVTLIILVLFGVTILEGASVGAGLAGMGVAAAFGAASVVMLLKKQKPRASEFAIKAAVSILAVMLLFGFSKLNGRIGRQGAESIAAACDEYKTKTGSYPASVEQLVPGYLSRIPAAKIALRWNHYWLKDNKVLFAGEPGMYILSYDLAAKQWGNIPTDKLFK